MILRSSCTQDPAKSALHARFVTACAVVAVIHEQPLEQVVATWGAPGGITLHGAAAACTEHGAHKRFRTQMPPTMHVQAAAMPCMCPSCGGMPAGQLQKLQAELAQLAARMQAQQPAMQFSSPSCAGATAGQLQKLQAELAQLAALAAQMAHSAGWSNLSILLLELAATAQAGVGKELFLLLQARPDCPAGGLPAMKAWI